MTGVQTCALPIWLDDQAILEASLASGNKPKALDAYAALIGDRYPVDTYRMYHCIRSRMWRYAPFASHADMMIKVARHAARRPFASANLKLLAAAVRHGPAKQRAGSG